MGPHLGDVLDDSKVIEAGGHDYEGAVVEHRRCLGAHVSRIMHPPNQRIAAHEHDWPVLTLYRLGSYRERAEDGRSMLFDGPSVVFQPAGAAHADEIGARGLETLAMTFDPAWLTLEARAALPQRTQWRPGGSAALAARGLANAWLAPNLNEAQLKAATSQFLINAFADATPPSPSWGEAVAAALEDEAPRTVSLARSLMLHPAWLAHAYRVWRGEGMAETARRRRVERAMLALRGSLASLAEVAAECGFCDQSHMNRAFRAVLGRTPLEVRREVALLAPIS
jgi:AraC-like DNA-binding protein